MIDFESLIESTEAADAGTVRRLLSPGPERDTLIREQLERLRAKADKLPTLVEELRELMVGRDLTQLINSVVVPAMTLGITGTESLADVELTSTWAAKVEYLVGVALSLPADGDADTPQDITQQVAALISDIFAADQGRMVVEFTAKADINGPDREMLLQQLRLEYQCDRMPGYPTHLEHVDTEVFGRHRDYYIRALGFDPADVVRSTRVHARALNQAFPAARDALAIELDSDNPDPASTMAMLDALNAITLWTPDAVATSTGIPIEQVTAMLEFFSATYGCQPEFRALSQPNRARTHPCIKLDDGTYFVPDLWSLSAAIHQRLAVEPKRDGFDPQKYHKHRQDAHERLVNGALERVFGIDSVHATQHYDPASGQHGEIDALVVSEWPLAVEAKAIALTDPGRRGAPDRVDKKIKEILGKALDQTDRALNYILDEAGRSFRRTANGRPVELLPIRIAGGTAVIVTFERIDPFAFGGLAVSGSVNRPTWVVSLTDLLMVADILTDPASFHHYARTRAGMHAVKASVAAESDALGAYLVDRLTILHDVPAENAARIVIADWSEALNDFYTRQELRLDAHKPTAGVPDDIITVLSNTLEQEGWAESVNAVMSSLPAVWKKWKKFRRRHRNGGTFALADRVSLVAVADSGSAVEHIDGAIRVLVPTLAPQGSAAGRPNSPHAHR
ncbi:hypothetical protein [Nocardia sp. NBC_01327]|uniref:hypothetical protein n=1 Tax=Nocardia sp. NBC_01327 TaxID=2903593 RepID=UPI002E10EA5A|nr:hypothetical protein OG326_21570 [Nocardia sp. NBC_01327]